MSKKLYILGLLICLMVSSSAITRCSNSDFSPSCTNGIPVGYINVKTTIKECICACNPGWEGTGCTIPCSTCYERCPNTFYYDGSYHYCLNGYNVGVLSTGGLVNSNCGCDCRGTGKYGLYCELDETCESMNCDEYGGVPVVDFFSQDGTTCACACIVKQSGILCDSYDGSASNPNQFYNFNFCNGFKMLGYVGGSTDIYGCFCGETH